MESCVQLSLTKRACRPLPSGGLEPLVELSLKGGRVVLTSDGLNNVINDLTQFVTMQVEKNSALEIAQQDIQDMRNDIEVLREDQSALKALKCRPQPRVRSSMLGAPGGDTLDSFSHVNEAEHTHDERSVSQAPMTTDGAVAENVRNSTVASPEDTVLIRLHERLKVVEEGVGVLPGLKASLQTQAEALETIKETRMNDKADAMAADLADLRKQLNVASFKNNKLFEETAHKVKSLAELQASIAEKEAARIVENAKNAAEEQKQFDMYAQVTALQEKVDEKAAEAAFMLHEFQNKVTNHLRKANDEWSKHVGLVEQKVASVYEHMDGYQSECESKLSAISANVVRSFNTLQEASLVRKAAVDKSFSALQTNDLAQIRKALTDLDSRIRQKDETFFSAKCLSCNRAFDEICNPNPNPNLSSGNQHDMHAEKSKHNLLARIQRDLNTGEIDNDLRLVSVKIGDATTDGIYHLRDEGHSHHVKNADVLVDKWNGKGGAKKKVAHTRAVEETSQSPRRTTWTHAGAWHTGTTDDYKYGINTLVGSRPLSCAGSNVVVSMQSPTNASVQSALSCTQTHTADD